MVMRPWKVIFNKSPFVTVAKLFWMCPTSFIWILTALILKHAFTYFIGQLIAINRATIHPNIIPIASIRIIVIPLTSLSLLMWRLKTFQKFQISHRKKQRRKHKLHTFITGATWTFSSLAPGEPGTRPFRTTPFSLGEIISMSFTFTDGDSPSFFDLRTQQTTIFLSM